MTFASNILPTDAVYYEFSNAGIVDGIMRLQAGGSASYTIRDTVLSALTEYFRVSVLTSEAIDRYAPTLYIYVHAVTTEGKEYYFTLTPTTDAGVIYTEELEMEATAYSEFTFVVYARQAVDLQLWELCPESTDSNIEVIIDGVKQSLPRLLYDYNILPLSVGQLETTIGMITFTLLDATDLQGHLEVSYVVSSDCVLTVRIYDTGTPELYTPILYDLKAGRGNFALPHAYLKRLKGLHSVYVTAQVSIGTLTIDTRGLLYTIDGGYLAQREIDAGVTVLDFSIQQTVGATDPTELWVVGIDTNEALVRSRSYDADPAVGFTPRYSIGYAKAAALEFNGDFILDTESNALKHTLITEEFPYAFWIDADDQLWCQQGEDETTRFLVDTNVSTVSACRGFNSLYYPTQDQGLIVLYIKDGIVTYRNYCYIDDTRDTWQGPFTIPLEEPAISAYVHRLNDYRVAFTVTTPTKNLWYITDRTYVTQASPVEQIYANATNIYPSVAVFPADFSYPAISVSVSQDETYKRIYLSFSYPIRALGDLYANTFVANPATVMITSVEVFDEHTLVVDLHDENYLGVTLQYRALDCNLQFSPLAGRWVPMTSFTIAVPGYDAVETIALTVSNVTGRVSQRGIETIRTAEQGKDTIDVSVAGIVASVTMRPIITSETAEQGRDTVAVSVLSHTGSVVMTQTGVSPI